MCVRTPGEGRTAAKAAKSCEVASFFRLPLAPCWGDEIFTSELDSSADAHIARKRKENADFHVVYRLANTQEGTPLFILRLGPITVAESLLTWTTSSSSSRSPSKTSTAI